MARYPISGYNDEALTAPATDVREIVAPGYDLDGRGRVFWLRGISITNEHSTNDAVVELWEQDEGAAVAANQRSTIYVPASSTVHVDYPEPGLKFLTNVCASTTAGTINAYGVSTYGFEE